MLHRLSCCESHLRVKGQALIDKVFEFLIRAVFQGLVNCSRLRYSQNTKLWFLNKVRAIVSIEVVLLFTTGIDKASTGDALQLHLVFKLLLLILAWE